MDDGRSDRSTTPTVVGDELIAPPAVLPGETMGHATKRGWLLAMESAFRKNDLPEQKRLQNLQAIAKEAIRRGLLTKDEVNRKLTELGIGLEANGAALPTLTTHARELATETRAMTPDQIASNPTLVAKVKVLQREIIEYKQSLIQGGQTEQAASAAIVQLLRSQGLQFESKQDTSTQPSLRTQPEKGVALPPVDYDALARTFSLDEQSPRKPETFFQPAVGNLFDRD